MQSYRYRLATKVSPNRWVPKRLLIIEAWCLLQLPLASQNIRTDDDARPGQSFPYETQRSHCKLIDSQRGLCGLGILPARLASTWKGNSYRRGKFHLENMFVFCRMMADQPIGTQLQRKEVLRRTFSIVVPCPCILRNVLDPKRSVHKSIDSVLHFNRPGINCGNG